MARIGGRSNGSRCPRACCAPGWSARSCGSPSRCSRSTVALGGRHAAQRHRTPGTRPPSRLPPPAFASAATSTAARCTPTGCGPSSPGARRAARRRRRPAGDRGHGPRRGAHAGRAGHLHVAAAAGVAIVDDPRRRGAGAAPIADAALRGRASRATPRRGLRCARAEGDVVEEQTFRDGLWLSSVETSWHPEDYGARIAAQVWG